MSVAVSPDGRTIVFDLLGDLYTVPVGGGTATRITSGRAFDTQPRFSPDGRAIAFSSDRSGSDNIWVVSPDGTGARAVTQDKDGGLSAPAWTPDGAYHVARKDPTYDRRGSAELRLYRADGTGVPGVGLTRRQDQGGLNPNGPAASPDGRFIYFSHGHRSLDATWVPWQVWRIDRHTGEYTQITAGYRGAVRPALSKDGRPLANVRRDHAQGALVLRDLETGEERDLANGLDRDDQRARRITTPIPGSPSRPMAGRWSSRRSDASTASRRTARRRG
jgi:Tol biopolymer transport system component